MGLGDNLPTAVNTIINDGEFILLGSIEGNIEELLYEM